MNNQKSININKNKFNMEEFIYHIAEILDITPEEVQMESKLTDFDNWDSLAALSFIAMVDEEYDISLKGEDIRKANTIEDLFEIIKSKK